ncbi:MAG: hypothetical protein U0165_09885 [Polyangiaceae bacterium]
MNRASILTFVVALACASLSIGCKTKIGDKCTTSTDCSTQGDRLCDTTEPGGYCTIFNCDPNSCPEEASCVAFDLQSDPLCYVPADSQRMLRTFCLRGCESEDDCRGGYTCATPEVLHSQYAALIVDGATNGIGVCIAKHVSPVQSVDAGVDDASCGPADVVDPPYTQSAGGSSGSGGSSGTGGTAGAGGTSGTGGTSAGGAAGAAGSG